MGAKCLNCGAEINGTFCIDCGQSSSISRLNIRHVISTAASHFFSMDSIVPSTFMGLTRNPGKVSREYVDGHRTSYVAPFRYCLTAVALLMLAYALVGRETSFVLFQTDRTLSPELLKFQADTLSFVLRNLNLVIFAALPLQALVLKGFFHRSRYNYAEVVSFYLYVMGHSFLFGTVLALTLSSASQLQFFLRILFQTLYSIFAAIGFFGENRVTTVFKCIGVGILNIIIVAAMVVLLIAPRFEGRINEIRGEKNLSGTEIQEIQIKRAMFIIYVSDQQVSRNFYTKVLATEPVLDVPGMTEFSLKDGSSLGLMPEAGIKKLLGNSLNKPTFVSGPLRAELYLFVDDPDSYLKRAVESGAEPLSECKARDWGDYAGYCLDMDGHVLGFGRPITESK